MTGRERESERTTGMLPIIGARRRSPIDRRCHDDDFRTPTKFRRRGPESITRRWSAVCGSFHTSFHCGLSFPLCLSNRRASLPPGFPRLCVHARLPARRRPSRAAGDVADRTGFGQIRNLTRCLTFVFLLCRIVDNSPS